MSFFIWSRKENWKQDNDEHDEKVKLLWDGKEGREGEMIQDGNTRSQNKHVHPSFPSL